MKGLKKFISKMPLTGFLWILVLVMVFGVISNSVFAQGQVSNFIRIGTSGIGGTWYPFGGTVALILEKYLPGIISSASATAGTIENLVLLRQNKIQMAMGEPQTVRLAYNGELDVFKGDPYKDLRNIFNTKVTFITVLTYPGSGVEKIEDIRGKIIGSGPPGSAVEIEVKHLLAAAGLTEKDVELRAFDRTDRSDALIDKRIHVAVDGFDRGSAVVEDLLSLHGAVFVKFSDEYLEKLHEVDDSYVPSILPAGSYSALKEDIKIPGLLSIMAVDKNVMDEEMVYNILNTIFEHHEEAIAINKTLGEVSLQSASVENVIPFHEGAIKFFKEKGVMK
ncbi:MAG TPA: TAXI family TRAP transporter solute-binding subunit [Atribacterota bacterium]|nr:TAXI family TRAP transporter solute-binding subunit [Atribacterota bacterium]